VVETVWPEDEREGISEQAIDALARRLRERLAEMDPETLYVVTVRGHGFRLENAQP
jgi:DNA-binding response OmpR family regulator